MRTATPTMPEPGFIALCIQLAQSTFSDVMPSQDRLDSAHQEASRSAGPSALVDDWFYRQQVKEREAYLAQSTDIFDLERRIRQLERRPHY